MRAYSPETPTEYIAQDEVLTDVIEQYRALAVATWEPYEFYGVGKEDTEAAADRAENRRAFLAGEVRNPKLAYPRLTDEFQQTLAKTEQSLIDMHAQTGTVSHDQVRIEAASDIVGRRHLEIWMLQISNHMQNHDLPDNDRKELAEMFNMINDDVHGELEVDRFNGLLTLVRQKAHTVILDRESETEKKEAAQYLIENTDMPRGTTLMPIKVDDQVVQDLRDVVIEKYADLLECVPEKEDGKSYTAEELAAIFVKAHLVRATGWDVAVVEGKANVDTRQSEEMTYIGADRKTPGSDSASKVVLHENGVHVERRIQGDKLGDPLLAGVGLARYLDAEEGHATGLEQIFDGKQSRAGVPYYLMLGLARGLDGDKPRDFREVFELEWRHQMIESDQPYSPELEEACKKQAYNSCVRIFRGTPCDIPGMVYTKDQAYFMGNQLMWELYSVIATMDKEDQRKWFDYLVMAKFDPTNPVHTTLVDRAILAQQPQAK